MRMPLKIVMDKILHLPMKALAAYGICHTVSTILKLFALYQGQSTTGA